MSRVSEDDIRSLARLARLRLSDEEVTGLGQDLSGILDHMEALAEVDTTGVEAMSHIFHGSLPGEQHLRADRIEPSLDQDTALDQAPRHEQGGFVVPAVLPSGDDK